MTEWPPSYQDIFWQAYPRRLDKKKAIAKLEIIRKSGVPFPDIISGVEGYARYVQGTEPQFIKHPTTWLNGRCWENEYPKAARSGESSLIAGMANVAARYGVTAGVGNSPYSSDKITVIDDGTGRGAVLDVRIDGSISPYVVNTSTDRK